NFMAQRMYILNEGFRVAGVRAKDYETNPFSVIGPFTKRTPLAGLGSFFQIALRKEFHCETAYSCSGFDRSGNGPGDEGGCVFEQGSRGFQPEAFGKTNPICRPAIGAVRKSLHHDGRADENRLVRTTRA